MTALTPPAHDESDFDFNPMLDPDRADPHLFYERARSRPIALSPSLGAYMVSRYADVQTVLADPDTFSSTAALPMVYDSPPEVVAILKEGGVPETPMVVNEDEPTHGPMRALFDAGVNGARVRTLLPVMQERADELIDGFDAGGAELVSEYAIPFVQRVINTVIGFPHEDAERIAAWTEDVGMLWNKLAPVEAHVEAAHRLVAYTAYLQELIDARRAEPREDMISVLVHGTDEVPGVDDAHVHNIIRGATRIAGFDTTRDAMTATILLALSDPTARRRITEDPTRALMQATEEALRRDAPHRGLFRVTTREVELGGTMLPQGSPLLLLFGSANRDETVFPDPDAVDLDRSNVHEHIAFGRGLHQCPGAPLARAEIRVALRTLFDRFPDLRLAPDWSPTYIASYFFRGLESLRVTW